MIKPHIQFPLYAYRFPHCPQDPFDPRHPRQHRQLLLSTAWWWRIDLSLLLVSVERVEREGRAVGMGMGMMGWVFCGGG